MTERCIQCFWVYMCTSVEMLKRCYDTADIDEPWCVTLVGCARHWGEVDGRVKPAD